MVNVTNKEKPQSVLIFLLQWSLLQCVSFFFITFSSCLLMEIKSRIACSREASFPDFTCDFFASFLFHDYFFVFILYGLVITFNQLGLHIIALWILHISSYVPFFLPPHFVFVVINFASFYAQTDTVKHETNTFKIYFNARCYNIALKSMWFVSINLIQA